MKILIVSDFFPLFHAPGGAATRTFCLMRELSKEHDLTLFTTKWPGVRIDEEEAKKVCKNIVYYDFVPKSEKKIVGEIASSSAGSTNETPRNDSKAKLVERFKELKHILFEDPQMVQSVKRHDESFRKAFYGLQPEKYDLIQIEDSYIAYRLYDFKKKYPKIPVIVDLHNINTQMEYRTFEYAKGWRWRLFCYLEALKMAAYEKKALKTFDGYLTCSEEDKQLGLSMAPGSDFEVIPNGVDTEFFKDDRSQVEPKSIFFLGSDWPPNVDGIMYFYKECFPVIRSAIPDIKLYIIGNFKNKDVTGIQDPNVVRTGYVDDVREYMRKCGVSIVPLRLGGGTRLKVLEAMSMGKALVSTSMGAEGITVTHGKDALLADSAGTFSDAVIRLLRDKDECLRLGRNARELTCGKYDWGVIGQALRNKYNFFDKRMR